MSHTSITTLSRSITALVTGGVLAVTLTACGEPGAPDPSASGSPSSDPVASASPTPEPPAASESPSPSPSPSPSGRPEPSATPGQPATPLNVDCLDLVSLDTMYEFDPNFGLQPAYAPAPGTTGSTAIGSGGIACGWVQQTSGEMIEISAARPSAATLDELRASAGAEAGSHEYFSSTGRTGIVQAFDGPYWVSASSTYFASAADARLLIDSMKAALD